MPALFFARSMVMSQGSLSTHMPSSIKFIGNLFLMICMPTSPSSNHTAFSSSVRKCGKTTVPSSPPNFSIPSRLSLWAHNQLDRHDDK